MEKGDLNIRFSKVQFISTARGRKSLPLKNDDYPVRRDLANTIKRTSRAESVMTSNDYELRGEPVARYIQRIGGAPTFPNANRNHPFWQRDFRAVVGAQIHRRRNGNPQSVMVLPKLWRNFNINQVAQAVNDEYPGFWQARLLEEFFKENVKIDHRVLPFRSLDDPIGKNFRAAALNQWVTTAVSVSLFRCFVVSLFRCLFAPLFVSFRWSSKDVSHLHFPVSQRDLQLNLRSDQRWGLSTFEPSGRMAARVPRKSPGAFGREASTANTFRPILCG